MYGAKTRKFFEKLIRLRYASMYGEPGGSPFDITIEQVYSIGVSNREPSNADVLQLAVEKQEWNRTVTIMQALLSESR